PAPAPNPAPGASAADVPDSAPGASPADARLRITTRRIDAAPDVERLFLALYGASRNAFWLDSSRPGPLARFSFMGADGGPRAGGGGAGGAGSAAGGATAPGAAAGGSAHPDLALLFADRVVALDHGSGAVHLLCLHEPGGEGAALGWLEATAARVEAIAAEPP